jgi:hypothetical protein
MRFQDDLIPRIFSLCSLLDLPVLSFFVPE